APLLLLLRHCHAEQIPRACSQVQQPSQRWALAPFFKGGTLTRSASINDASRHDWRHVDSPL
ncbi:hypothetical protein J7J50_23930, partial [Lysobacter sp. ISL-50]